jgi:hypothetical protein
VIQSLDQGQFMALTSTAMATSPAPESRSRPFLGRRNVVLLVAATVSLTIGYILLHNGGTTVAAALLVLGYCVFFPLGIAL